MKLSILINVIFLLIPISLADICFQTCFQSGNMYDCKLCEVGCRIYQVLSFKNKLTETTKLVNCRSNCKLGFKESPRNILNCDKGCLLAQQQQPEKL